MLKDRWFARIFLFPVLLLLLVAPYQTQAQEHSPLYHIRIDGVVTTITMGYMERALRLAEASNAQALIIELGSEGAVLRTIRPMAARLADATIPIVVYITPQQTAAGAAGAFFLECRAYCGYGSRYEFWYPVPAH
jgi:membrane-bound serine protease (ClpP class)